MLLLSALLATSLPAADAAPALINVDFEQTDIHAALRFLADVGNVNLVVGDDVKGTVTLQLHQVTWDEAFWAVLGQDHLTAVGVGSTFEVRPGS